MTLAVIRGRFTAVLACNRDIKRHPRAEPTPAAWQSEMWLQMKNGRRWSQSKPQQ